MRVIPREVAKRKPITWSKEIRELQRKLKLTPFQKEILVGTILGDGSLSINVSKTNFRLHIVHSEKQKKYVWWKYQIFQEWVLKPPQFREETNSWRFRTVSHPVFGEFHRIFYRNRKKIVPQEINKILRSPVSLAVWFMDDGALGPGPGRKGLTLNSQSFTKAENGCLRRCLKRNFSLKTTLHKDRNSYRIYILPVSVPRFRELIGEIVLSDFWYKFPFVDPVETTRWPPAMLHGSGSG